MKGYDLMTDEQRSEWDNLAERAQHSDTMRFSPVDAEALAEYEALAERLEAECQKDQAGSS